MATDKTDKKLVIVGGEGNGGVIASCVADNRRRHGDLEWQVAGFVNDYETQVCGHPVLGRMDDIPRLLQDPELHFIWAIHTIGRNTLIDSTFQRAAIPLDRLATVVHASAFISEGVTMDPGCFVMAGSYIAPQTHLGHSCMLMAHTILGHNTTLGPLNHLSAGCTVGAYITTGRCASVALGAVVVEKNNMGDYSVAGAMALVTHDIPPREIWAGRPARYMKHIREVESYTE